MERVWSTRDDVTCVHPGWAPLHGREPVLRSWRAILVDPPRIIATAPALLPLGVAMGLVCREVIGTTVLAAINIFVEEDGGWRIVFHQAGTTPEVAQTAGDDPRMLQ